MKKLLFPLIIATVGLCGCDQEITKEDIDKFIIENAEKWDDEFYDGFLTNFTMVVSTDYRGDRLQNSLKVGENGAYIDILGISNSRYIIKEDSVYKQYVYHPSLGKYVKEKQDYGVEDYNHFVNEGALYVSFKTLYEKFTFDENEHAYKCAEGLKCELKEEIYRGSYLVSYNTVVKFEEGKLVSMSGDYYFYRKIDENTYVNEAVAAGICKEGEHVMSYKITDINRTVVTAPTDFVLEE